MFAKLRITLKKMLKKTQRTPETKFVNPYAMSDTTTPQYHVKPEFRDGRFILKKEETMHDKKEKEEKDEPELTTATGKPNEKKVVKKEPGFIKILSEVVAADLKSLSGEERRKARELKREEKEFKEYKLRRAAEEKRVYEEFLKSREKHLKHPEHIITEKERIDVIPAGLELELLPAIEPVKEVVPEVVEPDIEMQPVHEITGNDITVSTLKRTLKSWRTFEPKAAKK